jgi:ribonuclease J
MNTNNRENNLDKWLQKNTNHLSNNPSKDSSDRPLNVDKNTKKGFFDRFKKKPAQAQTPNTDQKPVHKEAKAGFQHKHTPKNHNGFKKPMPGGATTNPPHHKPTTAPKAVNGHPVQKNEAYKSNNSKSRRKPFIIKPKYDLPQQQAQPNNKPKASIYHDKVRFIPLGGLNEVGKNMMAIEYGNDIIIIDMGLQFPDEDMLGVDYIVPDITYLKDNMHKIRGTLITHGHLDHIGGISFMAPQINSPALFGLRLTMGLIKKQIEEHSTAKGLKLVTVEPKQKFKLGVFTVQFFRVNHSIPDSAGIIIETPEGLIVHTGDFKFDFTPADGLPMDMETLKWLGTQKVLALFSDSTNSMKPGHTLSEKVIGETLDEIIGATKGRLIIASFSSLIGRMQQVLNAAMKYNRKVFVSGRSMVDNIEIATKLGYLKYPKDLVKQLNRSKKEATNDKALILTTGSQGEAMSALTRMSLNEHKHVKINAKDTVIFSSNPIIGNEKGIIAVVNELCKKGATVISNQIMDVHTTGHGHQEDLKLMLELVKPKYFIPVHGEYYMRKAHVELAVTHNLVNPANTILAENGNVIEAKNGVLTISKETVPSNYILVDNQSGGLSDIAYSILSERQAMAGNGVITINIPLSAGTKIGKITVESHGFIYMKETKRILDDIKNNSKIFTERFLERNKNKFNKEQFTIELRAQSYRLLSDKIERRPLVIVNLIEF